MANDPYQRRVTNVMTRDVVSIKSGDSVHAALVLMVENRISALPVVDPQQCCVGMLSATDLVDLTRSLVEDLSDPAQISRVLQQWLSDNPGEEVVGREVLELMTSDVVSVAPETRVVDAAAQMLQHKVHRLPVLDEQRQLMGIISTMDILTAFTEGDAGA